MKRRKLAKVCKGCNKRKPLRCFYPSAKCRDCTGIITEQYRKLKRAE